MGGGECYGAECVCVEGVFYVHRPSVDGGSVVCICGACSVVWHAGDCV